MVVATAAQSTGQPTRDAATGAHEGAVPIEEARRSQESASRVSLVVPCEFGFAGDIRRDEAEHPDAVGGRKLDGASSPLG